MNMKGGGGSCDIREELQSIRSSFISEQFVTRLLVRFWGSGSSEPQMKTGKVQLGLEEEEGSKQSPSSSSSVLPQPLDPGLSDDPVGVLLQASFVALVGPLLHGLRGVLVLVVFDHRVGDDGQNQNRQQDVELVLQAQEGAVGEGDDEAQRLPHAVVGEGRLLLPGEEDAVQSCEEEQSRSRHPVTAAGSAGSVPSLTVGLGLPDGVRHPPQGGKHEEDGQLVRVGPPEQQSDDAGEVRQGR